MIGRYRAADETQGRAAYLHDSGADCLDDDPAFGTLWCRDPRGDEPLMMLEVRTARPNPTARASTLPARRSTIATDAERRQLWAAAASEGAQCRRFDLRVNRRDI